MVYNYAQRLSLTGFLNALLNEWQDYQKSAQEIVIRAVDGDLVLPLLHDSLVQRFSFAWPAKIRYQGVEKVIRYQDVIDFICQHPRIAGRYSLDQVNNFKAQVFSSQAHMQDALSLRSTAITIDGFITAEQSLIGGHNLHPASKAHQGWSLQQARIFSPDYEAEFSLHWYFVKNELLIGESAYAKYSDIGTSLAKLLMRSYKDAGIKHLVPDGFVPYPVHPYQALLLRNNHSLQHYFCEGLIIDLNKQGRAWRATSSTRTLWQQNSHWMLKFSLAVKLTNSIRRLSATELSRGVLFQQLSNEVAGIEFNQRFPSFKLLQEPAWCGLQDLNGEVILDSLFCWRENPYLTGKEPTVMLASMTQEDSNGSNAILKLVSKLAKSRNISLTIATALWFEHFLENVIKPIAVARADYGIVMQAHQQNLLVTLADFLPVGGAFRDCQGTDYCDAALNRFQLLTRKKNAFLVKSDEVNPSFSYYLIINSLNSVIAALSISLCSIESQGLLRMSQNLWRELAQHCFYDRSFYNYLLQSDCLKIKGNFFYFLAVNDENELQIKSKIYVDTENPYRFENVSQPSLIYKAVLFDMQDPEESQTGLNLLFTQQQQLLTVESSWQQWHLQWHVDIDGGYHLSMAEALSLPEQTVNSGLTVQTKMSAKQWFNVITHFFSDLVLSVDHGKQQVVEQLFISEQTWMNLTNVAIPSKAVSVSGQVVIKRCTFFT